MMLIAITIIISFLLEGLASVFLPFVLGKINILYPMFILGSLILIYPYFDKKGNNFIKTALLLGTFYDFIYTNVFPFSVFLFFMIAILIKYFYNIFSYNAISIIFIYLIILISYELSNFVILNIINYKFISFYDFFYKLYNSVIINLIYIFISYFILTKIGRKRGIRKID